jgi:hypothetical protein
MGPIRGALHVNQRLKGRQNRDGEWFVNNDSWLVIEPHALSMHGKSITGLISASVQQGVNRPTGTISNKLLIGGQPLDLDIEYYDQMSMSDKDSQK